MAHLLGGFPRAIQGLATLAEVRAERGLPPPDPDPGGSTREQDGQRGRALFETIYGSQSENVLANLRAAAPGYDRWVLEHAYGRVLSRPPLTAAERELFSVAALVVLECPRQLVSHARGALRTGVDPRQLDAMLDLLGAHFDAPAIDRARAAMEAVRERRGE